MVGLLKKIANNFTELNERERVVMKERFGIEMPRTPTLEEVQSAFEKARQKIRDIEAQARAGWTRKPPGGDEGSGSPPGDSPKPNG